MAEEIDNTGDLTGGAYQIPSASDSGSEVFNILETFMKRMATHKHDGTDGLVIDKKVDKTVYKAGEDETADVGGTVWQTGTNGNFYLIFTLPTADTGMHLTASGAAATDVNDLVRKFYYLSEDHDSAGTDAHVEFVPDLEWTAYNTVRVHTNIKATIEAASAGVGTVYMKVF